MNLNGEPADSEAVVVNMKKILLILLLTFTFAETFELVYDGRNRIGYGTTVAKMKVNRGHIYKTEMNYGNGCSVSTIYVPDSL